MPTADRRPESGSPYRGPSFEAAHSPKRNDQAGGASPWTVGLLAALSAVALSVALTAWRDHRLGAAITSLPTALQQETYDHVRDELMHLCATDRLRLDDRCRDQASFLLAFPQCDDACRALALPFLRGDARK
ncbi:MAG: hypothetical protein JWN44_2594 [Myxococcales bacterium]|nr:hypothetical protein [Myxococcales bacterium]